MIWVRFPAETRDFSLLHSVKTGSVSHTASYPVGTAGCSLGLKRQEQEPSSSAKAKNGAAILGSSICLHGIMLKYIIKHRDIFIFFIFIIFEELVT
jgi:hypothetical protein